MRENVEYNRFLISQFVFRCGLTLSIPLFPLYWVRELNAPDSWIGVINTVNSAELQLADLASGAVRTILAIPGEGVNQPRLAAHDTQLYFTRGSTSGDIWTVRFGDDDKQRLKAQR